MNRCTRDNVVNAARKKCIADALKNLAEPATIVRDKKGVMVGVIVPTTHEQFEEVCVAMNAPTIAEVAAIETVRRYISDEFFCITGTAARGSMYSVDDLYSWFLIWCERSQEYQMSLADFEYSLSAVSIIVTSGQTRGLIEKEAVVREDLIECI